MVFKMVLPLVLLAISARGYSGRGAGLPAPHSGPHSGPYSRGAYGGPHIPIISYENVNNGDGNYRYSYEAGNGIKAHERGSPGAAGAVAAAGGYSYTAPDGQQVSLTYTADAAGFRPAGAHLPTPPPVPDAILRSLQLIRQSSNAGSYTQHHADYPRGGYHY